MKNLLVAIALFSSILVQAQNEPAKPAQNQPTAAQVLSIHYARTYQAAMRYNDFSVAKSALLNLLVENPQNDSILYSLSVLYYQMQQYASAALSAQDVLTINPDNIGALEVAAVSYESIGAREKALETYETLYLKTDDFQVLYKMAFLQYDMKKYSESRTNADILLGKKEALELKSVYKMADGTDKEFPIKAALLNLKGLISKEEGDKAAAKGFFEQALAIAPDFQMAKDNLDSLAK